LPGHGVLAYSTGDILSHDHLQQGFFPLDVFFNYTSLEYPDRQLILLGILFSGGLLRLTCTTYPFSGSLNSVFFSPVWGASKVVLKGFGAAVVGEGFII